MKIYTDGTTRIFMIIMVVVVSYLLFSFIFQLFSPQPQTMYEMMQRMMGYQTPITNTASIAIALVMGLISTVFIKSGREARIIKRYDKEYALKIIKKKLSQDEKNLLKEVERTEKITQDSLRARLGWSKAKISTILTRLDKMNLIQKERSGKTYNIFLSKEFKQNKRFNTVSDTT